MKVSDSKDIIYLDNAATSWPKPAGVSDTMSDIIRYGCANPGRSGHRMSVDTARMIFSVRDSVSGLIKSPDPLRIAFFNNATCALNAAINGLITTTDHVITTSMEHNSVMRPLRALETCGTEITIIPCAFDGTIDPSAVKKAVRKNTKAVVITHSSNVIGTIMPVDEIAAIAHDNRIIIIVDGAQTAGIVPVDVFKSNIDIFAFTGHKGLYGPQGTGGIYIRKGLEDAILPVITGGTGSNSEKEEQPEFMPDKFESGTPNSPGIAGLGAGIDFISTTGIDQILGKEQILTQKLIDGLLTIKGVSVYGLRKSIGRSPVVSINIKDKSPSDVSQRLDDDFGIMTRPGLHCAPAAHRTIGTFRGGTVRFSIGYFNSEEDIEKTLCAVDIIASGK